jgi:hypothetical protein
MKKQVKICLKTAWMVAASTILLTGTSLCVSTDEACLQTGDSMSFLMFLISFPTGMFFFVASTIYLDGGTIHYPSEFITTWMIMTCGGLLQWFVIVPRMFEKRSLTTLNLEMAAPPQGLVSEQGRTKTGGDAFTSAVPALPDVAGSDLARPVASTVLSVTRSRTKTRRTTFMPIAAFDRKGRTPLERVIDHL